MNFTTKHHRKKQEDLENPREMKLALARLAAAWGATLILDKEVPFDKPQQ